MSKATKTTKTTNAKKEIIKTVTKARKEYYANNEVLTFKSSVKYAKDSNNVYLSKKSLFVVNYLLATKKENGYAFTLDAMTNAYRKAVKENAEKKAKVSDYTFRSNFYTNEVITINDFQSARSHIYDKNKRLFDYYKNAKGNYLIKEVDYKPNLIRFESR